ncbi:complex I subunit 5 family protein [Thiovibrio sp. JS02]
MPEFVLHAPWQLGLIVLPLAAALAGFLLPGRLRFVALAGSGGALLCLAGLAGRFCATGSFRHAVGGWGAPLGIDQAVDGPALILLMMTAVVGSAVSLYAEAYFGERLKKKKRRGLHTEQRRFFWPLWFLLWAGLNNLFLAADIFNQYVSLELIGLASVALTALSGKAPARFAAMRYLLVSMAGSLCFLLGIALLYAAYGVLDLVALRSLLVPGGAARFIFALIIVGLLLKTAIFPLHFWLPPAHANAMAPVSALLSALVVKAGFFLVLRFWFGLFAPLVNPGLASLLAALGVCAMLWGSIQALRQQRLKMLVAYSTVAQLGLLPIALSLTAFAASPAEALFVLLLFMVAHACAKAAMFLASGTIWLSLGHDLISRLAPARRQLPIVTFALALAGLSLIGLPPGGGFVAKWSMLSLAVAGGSWFSGLAIICGSLLTTFYIYRLIRPWFNREGGGTAVAPDCHWLLHWLPMGLALLALCLGFLAPGLALFLRETAVMAGGGP